MLYMSKFIPGKMYKIRYEYSEENGENCGISQKPFFVLEVIRDGETFPRREVCRILKDKEIKETTLTIHYYFLVNDENLAADKASKEKILRKKAEKEANRIKEEEKKQQQQQQKSNHSSATPCM